MSKVKYLKTVNFEKIRLELLRGPRLNNLMEHFEDIASLKKQIPISEVTPLQNFLQSKINLEYYQVFKKNCGPFFNHAMASIPYALEEHCRVSVAINRYAQYKIKEAKESPKEPLKFYELSAADGTNARTLGEFSKGLVKTLSDTPNQANYENFVNLLTHKHSFIYKGPFVNITKEYLSAHRDLALFAKGFDIILEPLVFQMYGKKRKEPIAYMRRLLKEDGLFFFMEKLLQKDEDEYNRREELKDTFFKNQYFSPKQIDDKKINILSEMRQGQVTLDMLLSGIKANFRYAWMIWNSANFYEIVASDSFENIDLFMSLIDDPYVPDKFLCDKNLTMKRVL